ncbi:nitroreductase family protein [Amycolatopsis sp.]|uniref:nitroreductase family protein n=1 Tax=Amycolatopsis sp. TaxID=37632 RepID=UPI002D7E72AB|nr:nitroreductase family protein [Amycolatopsis sp.]HET6710328.1 nitroreductase family protein [Amycolatopsis sp.]
MEIDHLLSTTRAVRRKLDLDRPVEPEVLDECLNLALQAPTPGNVQAWRWLVVRDQDVKDRLSVLFREVGEAYLTERASAAPSRMLASGRHLLEVIDRVPVFVIPVLAGRPAGDNAVDAAFYGGIFPAVWNFQLALRSRGLGSTLTTYHLAREAEAAEILGIPAGHTQAGLLPVAYTTVPDFKPAARSPLSEVAYLDQWGTPLS